MNRNNHVRLLGYWASILFTLTGILYGTSMGLLLSKYTIPEYIELDQFLRLVDDKFVDLYTFCQVFAFISALLFIVVLCCIHTQATNNNKIFSLLSICFGLGFAILACLNYFIQFSIVRISLNEGIIQNLENFVQFNPRSFSFAVNMLAWSLFLGLSSLFLGIIYKGNGVNLAIRYSFYVTSLFCFIGFIGFIGDSQILQLLFQMGMTLGLTFGAIFLAFSFNKSRFHNTHL